MDNPDKKPDPWEGPLKRAQITVVALNWIDNNDPPPAYQVRSVLEDTGLAGEVSVEDVVRAWHFNRIHDTSAYRLVSFIGEECEVTDLPDQTHLRYAQEMMTVQHLEYAPLMQEGGRMNGLTDEQTQELIQKMASDAESLLNVTLPELRDVWRLCREQGLAPFRDT